MQLARYEELAAVSSMKARVELVEWKSYMLQIAAAPANCRVRVMKQLAAQGVAPYGTIRRKFYAYNGGRDGKGLGATALVDRRCVRHITAANPWLECYMSYIENDANTSMGGYRQMMADFRKGRPMVGAIGTWRDVWAAERPGEPVPEECPLDWTPHGATYANLQAVAKANPNYQFNIFANRQQRGCGRCSPRAWGWRCSPRWSMTTCGTTRTSCWARGWASRWSSPGMMWRAGSSVRRSSSPGSSGRTASATT